MAPSMLNSNQVTLVAVVTLCFIISTLSISLRLWGRRLTRSKLWWDDWTAVIAWVLSVATNIFIYVSIKAGLGRHISELTPEDLTVFGLSFYLQELSWTLAMGFVVQSILTFYIRLFPIKKWLRYSNYVLMAFNTGWTIATFLALTFQCTPVQYFWNRMLPNGYCMNNAPLFYFINGTISMITVFFVLLLPTPILLKLQVSRGKKWGLVFSFTVGTFVCAMSVLRLISIRAIDNADLPWSTTFPGMWSCVETNVAVASACIPSLTPLLRALFGKPVAETRHTEDVSSGAIYTEHSVLQSFDSRPFTGIKEPGQSWDATNDHKSAIQTTVRGIVPSGSHRS